MGEDVPCDWRLVRVEQKGFCRPEWVAQKKIESLGFYYLLDANRHVHICSFTPTYEMNALVGYATFSEEVSDQVREEVDIANDEAEEPVTYMDVSQVDRLPRQDVNKLAGPPEPGEDRETYYDRIVGELVEHFRGNHPCF